MRKPRLTKSLFVEAGRRGGKNSRVNLTPERSSEIARKAVAARWAKARAERAAAEE